MAVELVVVSVPREDISLNLSPCQPLAFDASSYHDDLLCSFNLVALGGCLSTK